MAHSPQQGSTVRNHLLAALSPKILSPLLPKFSSVDLPVRQVPHAPEAPIEAVYFPQTGMVSLVAGMEEGGQGEVGVIGREGMVGLPLVMGVEDAFIEADEDKLAAPARVLRDPAARRTSGNSMSRRCSTARRAAGYGVVRSPWLINRKDLQVECECKITASISDPVGQSGGQPSVLFRSGPLANSWQPVGSSGDARR